MEKYGIEKDSEHPELLEKIGEVVYASSCEHPNEVVEQDGDTQFCHKCEKYINRRPN